MLCPNTAGWFPSPGSEVEVETAGEFEVHALIQQDGVDAKFYCGAACPARVLLSEREVSWVAVGHWSGKHPCVAGVCVRSLCPVCMRVGGGWGSSTIVLQPPPVLCKLSSDGWGCKLCPGQKRGRDHNDADVFGCSKLPRRQSRPCQTKERTRFQVMAQAGH